MTSARCTNAVVCVPRTKARGFARRAWVWAGLPGLFVAGTGFMASAQVCFDAPTVLTIGSPPRAPVMADFNGDAILDLALLEPQVASVTIRLGSGDEHYAPGVRYPVLPAATRLSAADIDQDGDQDLVLLGTTQVAVLRNQSNGTFAPYVQYSAGLVGLAVLKGLAIADFDSDGDVDIVLAQTADFGSTGASSQVGILTNQSGAFPTAPAWATIPGMARDPEIVAFDIDGDGDLELAVSTNDLGGSGSVRVFATTAGRLGAATPYALPGRATSILSADLDADGLEDLAVSTTSAVSVLRNLGGGFLAAPVQTPPSAELRRAVAADLDSDGDVDIAATRVQVSSAVPAGVVVYRNLGAATFVLDPAYPVASDPNEVIAADYDGDGDDDLCVMSPSRRAITLLTNPGNGVFRQASDTAFGGYVWRLTAADLDSDGDQDVIGVDGNTSIVRMVTNDGSGTFVPASSLPLTVTPLQLAALDFNTDGHPDLAVVATYVNQVVLYRNTAPGFVLAAAFTVGSQPSSATSADIDGDLDLDLIVTNQGSNTISVLRNQGGVFAAPTAYDAWLGPEAVSAGDMDGDGDVDLVVANVGVSVLYNQGAGTFAAPANYSGFASPNSIATGDFDADGDLDVAIGSDTHVSVFQNLGGGTLGSRIDYAVGGPATDLASRDLDADGDLDLVALVPNSDMMVTLLNGGLGTFGPADGFLVGNEGTALACADFDGDGDSDAMVGRFTPNTVRLLRNCAASGYPVCAGDGLGTTCPCGNNSPSSARAGCQNSFGLAATLRGAGSTSLGHDGLILRGASMPNGSALYFQGNALVNGGAGSVFGDGLLCATTGVVRLGAKQNVAGASTYPSASDPSVSVRGSVSTPGTRHYQIWYRNNASFCTSAVFNTSNGLRVVWQL
ncbi:MAG: VCBS repeat-containing protein [Planctomycetota bacterium]|nr:VCBS repeat-containing protein [Planctomycetota bacterium]